MKGLVDCMVAIHLVHRRMAEITIKARKIGGYDLLPLCDRNELYQCLEVSAKLVQRLDGLKNMAFVAHLAGDTQWEQDICRKIEELEASCL